MIEQPKTSQVIDAIFGPAGSRTGDVWLCHFPEWETNWTGGVYPHVKAQAGQNNLFAVSTYKHGSSGRKVANFSAMHVLVADDVGTKAKAPPLEPSYKLETSPGNFQWGYILEDPITDGDLADRLVDALIAVGYCDAGADGPRARYVRLPGINGKPEHVAKHGKAPEVRFTEWNPARKFGLDEIIGELNLNLGEAKSEKSTEWDGVRSDVKREQLIGNILEGVDLHGSTMRLAASLAASKVPTKVNEDVIRALMTHSNAPRDERFDLRFEDIPRVVKDGEAKFAPKPSGPIEIIPASEFAKRPRPEWIIKGILPRAELGVLYGESGAGKSFVALDMVWHIALALEWHGRRVRGCRVVYVVAEGVGGFQTRLQALSKHRGVDLARAPIGIMSAAPNLLEGGEETIITAIQATGGAGLVVIDTLAQTTPGANENTSEDMGKALAAVKRISAEVAAMVLVIHHAGKDLDRGARGWSGLKAAADVQIAVGRPGGGDERVVRLEKSKDGLDGIEYPFRLDSVYLGEDGDGDAITSCVVQWQDRKPKAWKPTGQWQKLVIAAIEELTARDIFDDQITYPHRVAVDDVLKIAVSKVARDTGKEDRRRESARRAVTAITESGLYRLADDGLTLEIADPTNPTFTPQSGKCGEGIRPKNPTNPTHGLQTCGVVGSECGLESGATIQ